MEKVKIVLDADVLIHFCEAERLSMLPEILSEFEHVVLDVVYKEVFPIQNQLDNQIRLLKNIKMETFNPSGEMLFEYAKLSKTRGKGESACMSYCRFTNNVIGSSNIRDIKAYCKQNKITYLTTLDFLYYAFQRGKMTEDECKKFVEDVQANGSKLPNIDITKYIPENLI